MQRSDMVQNYLEVLDIQDRARDFDLLREVVRRRGGYCFEQNGLAFAILEELG